MPAASHPITPAVRALRAAKVEFEPLLYQYQEKGGTARSSSELGWDEHAVIKTLVVRNDAATYLALMHGDRELSLRNLARHLKCKSLDMASPAQVTRVTGYQVGGVSPFGTRQAIPIFAQASIAALDRIAINGGKRGFLVSLTVNDLNAVLGPSWIDIAA